MRRMRNNKQARALLRGPTALDHHFLVDMMLFQRCTIYVLLTNGNACMHPSGWNVRQHVPYVGATCRTRTACVGKGLRIDHITVCSVQMLSSDNMYIGATCHS